MAKLVSCTVPMTEVLADIADLCVREWQQQGSNPASASTTLTGERLTITIHDGLSRADRQLVRYSPGRIVVRRNAMRRVDHFYPQLAGQIETRLNCFVANSDVTIDPGTGDIHLCITLRDVTRAMWPTIALSNDAAAGHQTMPSAA